MRLPAEKIKEAILHPDREVREAAVFYFADSHSPDPTIMPLVIQAMDRYGLDAFSIYSFDLAQTSDTVAWLVQEIERVGEGSDERDAITPIRCGEHSVERSRFAEAALRHDRFTAKTG